MPLRAVLRFFLASFPESAGRMRLADRKMAAEVTQIDSTVCTTPCKQIHLHELIPRKIEVIEECEVTVPHKTCRF